MSSASAAPISPLDVRSPDGNGIDILRSLEAKRRCNAGRDDFGHATIRDAVEATRNERSISSRSRSPRPRLSKNALNGPTCNAKTCDSASWSVMRRG
jgi:hypothetical protein